MHIQKLRFFHPFLFALYPVLLLISLNLYTLAVFDILRVLFSVFIGVLFLLLIFWLVFKNKEKTFFVTSLLVILVLFIDYSNKLPDEITLVGIDINQRWLVFLFWIVIIFVLSQIIWKRLPGSIVNRYLTITSIILLLIPAYNFFRMNLYFRENQLDAWDAPEWQAKELKLPDTDRKPDIFYIIVDGYAGEETLRTIYNFDNSDFLDFLEETGFYIAANSKSNYIQTALSLASSLNFNYLDLYTPAGNSSNNRTILKELINNNHSRFLLEGQGYQLVYIYSGYEYTDIQDADIYISPIKNMFTSLEGLLINSTGLSLITNLFGIEDFIPGYDLHRRIIHHQLEQLEKIPIKYHENPKFIFAHIILPHPPFVYDREGNEINPQRPYTISDGSHYQGSDEEYVDKYIEQLIHTNDMLRTALSKIIDMSNTPPIIILQADHGPGAYLDWDSSKNSCLMERFSILNAYLLPGPHDSILYPEISPVNTFRVIFNAYFDAELDILQDHQYYSPWQHPYQYVDVTNNSGRSCIID